MVGTDICLIQTDETALYLISVVAPPIVQQLVDQSELKFNAANITYVDLIVYAA